MFTGKTALITGASSGLGRELSLEFARLNVNLALFDRDEVMLKKTGQDCRDAGAETLEVAGDVTSAEDCRDFINDAEERFGTIDYLVACAGISMWAKFEDVQDVSMFRTMMDINYLGVVHCSYFALPHLKKSGGMIVVISSIQGKVGVPFHTGYVASKFALQGFFESLRIELEGQGVDILMVLPHWLRGTNLRSNAFGKNGQALGSKRKKHTGEFITVEKCRNEIIKAMKKRKRELIIPPKLRLLLWLNLITPGIVRSIIKKKTNQPYADST